MKRRKTVGWLGYFKARTVVHPETGCWEWQLTKKGGYGACSAMPGVTIMAHRVAYIALRGPIPEGMTTDHLCRNRACVNPDHLEVVTQRENTLRAPKSAATVNAAKTHCVNDHEFTAENTYISTQAGRTRRSCRACNRAAARRRLARLKEIA